MYSFIDFTTGNVLTEANLDQMSANIRDHVHGVSDVAEPNRDYKETLRSTIFIDGYSVAPGIIGRKASGTEAVPTNTKRNDDLVLLVGIGHTGSAWTIPSGYAGLYATEDWSGTANGTAFVVGLTANGIAAPSPYAPPRFVIYGDGRVIINGNTPVTASAALEIKGTNGALLLPRMDVAQRNALAPTDGMVIYLTGYGLHARTLGSWQNIITGGGPDIYSAATGFVGIGGTAVASCKLAINGTDGALLLPRLDVTQRNALAPTDGMILYLTGYGFHGRNNGAWANFVMGSGPDIWALGTGRVGIGGTPSAFCKLDINGTDGALRLPRLTVSERDAITTPLNGMMIYLTDYGFHGYSNGSWSNLVAGSGPVIWALASGRVGVGASPSAFCKLEINGTDGAFRLPRLTTSERDAITTPLNGMMIYNTTLNKFQCYENSAWANLI